MYLWPFIPICPDFGSAVIKTFQWLRSAKLNQQSVLLIFEVLPFIGSITHTVHGWPLTHPYSQGDHFLSELDRFGDKSGTDSLSEGENKQSEASEANGRTEGTLKLNIVPLLKPAHHPTARLPSGHGSAVTAHDCQTISISSSSLWKY